MELAPDRGYFTVLTTDVGDMGFYQIVITVTYDNWLYSRDYHKSKDGVYE